ncbi:MAG: 2OG-Fe(II) oxygenase [Sphingobacteriaceae bacterium]|nr:2OG-Fe(II) oxygenase [Cytophagaceae bacterium]
MSLPSDWSPYLQQLDTDGYILVPSLFDVETCQQLIASYSDNSFFRKTISMARHQFGLGEYKYFQYPLPDLVQRLRTDLYPLLVPVANEWMQRLGNPVRFPKTHPELLARCAEAGQLRPTPLLLRYEPGGYNALHQDLYGEVYFPFQALVVLSEAGEEFTGGELVLVEQRPRAHSKAVVLTPRRGDLVIFTTQFRPVRGTRGHYRVTMKHGVSPLRSGLRYTLGVIFHDAK